MIERKDLDLAVLQEGVNTIAVLAGKEILTVYEDDSLFGQVDFKADNSPLTLADKAAHQLIVRELDLLQPGIPVLSEEGKEIDYEVRKRWPLYWCVDPLDGTKEFVKRNGEFTVNIALMNADQPILGVVYVPVSGTLYYARHLAGAYKQLASHPPKPIEVGTFSMDQTGLRIVCSRTHLSPKVEAYLKRFEAPVQTPMGSSLKFMLLAEGNADIYPRLGPTMEWDTAAAHIIVEEAGGKVLQLDGKALIYNKQNLLNPHFLATGKEI